MNNIKYKFVQLIIEEKYCFLVVVHYVGICNTITLHNFHDNKVVSGANNNGVVEWQYYWYIRIHLNFFAKLKMSIMTELYYMRFTTITINSHI